MRLSTSLILIAACGLANAQVWEKRLAPGLVYREEIDRSVPRIVHVLKWSVGTPVIRADAELGADAVFDQTPNKGRETVSKMVARTGALGGINGDFFQVPYTGDPIGLMVRNGEMISAPIVPRSVFGWSGDKLSFGLADWLGEVSLDSSTPVPLDGVNEQAGANRITLDTETAGWAFGKAPDVALIVKLDPGTWSPEGSRTGEVTEVVRDLASRKLMSGLAVVIATGDKTSWLRDAHVGQKIKFTSHATGLDWKTVENAVGGGPFLVRDGKVAVDWKAQRFKDAFATLRHPRSAVGMTADGDLLLVAVDGRAPGLSEGATLNEMAQIMAHLGCTDAMNLDGGGSTCLDLHGQAMNRPSDGSERPVANAILLFEDDPAKAGTPPKAKPFLSVRVPMHVYEQTDATLTVRDAGQIIPNSEILWSASGAAWIDQGGTLHPIHAGDCRVTIWSRGSSTQTTLTVLKKPSPRKARAPSAPRRRTRPRGRLAGSPTDTARP